MAETWSLPFLDAFSSAGNIQVYEVSFIDSWLLSSSPVRQVFLKVMTKSNNPQRHAVYAFGDHYYFRKKLHILNLLTG
jgi:ATPase complex subunit ATP10